MKRCTRCGRILKNPKSVINGMGPVCFRKWKSSLESQGNGTVFLEGDYGDDVVLKRIDGKAATNVLCVRAIHSPTGFEWGYGGSGPADLAYNILIKYGTSLYQAEVLHQEFKWKFIAPMPAEGGTIKGADIREWLTIHAVEAAL